jgi:hypothetical protein
MEIIPERKHSPDDVKPASNVRYVTFRNDLKNVRYRRAAKSTPHPGGSRGHARAWCSRRQFGPGNSERDGAQDLKVLLRLIDALNGCLCRRLTCFASPV